MTTQFLLYGSYGYTGALIADLAVKRGMRPILSGRDANRLKVQADALELEHRPVSLDDPGSIEVALKDVPLVLNCAGPFHRTFQPITEACLRTGKHYLDITGEIMVFEALAARSVEAREVGVMLLPGVGFDVVPSDCLAVHLKQRLPEATHLTLALNWSGGGTSHGTLLTAIEGLPEQGVVRKDGKLVQVALPGKTRKVDFGRGPRMAMNIPWGDVSTAYHSTGIPNIETYMVFPKNYMIIARLLSPFIGMAGKPFIQQLLRNIVMKSPPGPSEEARQRGRSRLWGEASDDFGVHVVSRMETPEGYALTIETALAVVRRALDGDFRPGFQTPRPCLRCGFHPWI